jgi:hypothetical protein
MWAKRWVRMLVVMGRASRVTRKGGGWKGQEEARKKSDAGGQEEERMARPNAGSPCLLCFEHMANCSDDRSCSECIHRRPKLIC